MEKTTEKKGPHQSVLVKCISVTSYGKSTTASFIPNKMIKEGDFDFQQFEEVLKPNIIKVPIDLTKNAEVFMPGDLYVLQVMHVGHESVSSDISSSAYIVAMKAMKKGLPVTVQFKPDVYEGITVKGKVFQVEHNYFQIRVPGNPSRDQLCYYDWIADVKIDQ